MEKEDHTHPESESTICTIVVCHGGETKRALYKILACMNCDVCEVTSLSDLLTSLKDSEYTSLRFSDNHNESLQESCAPHAPGADQTMNAGHDDPSGSSKPKTIGLDFYTRSIDKMTLREIEAIHIRKTLTRCGWKYKLAARELGIDRTTLYRKMKKFSITPEEPKPSR
ncbi:helix-turn-helix domain-containing protein [Candidatus Latescibacterota bacterium]